MQVESESRRKEIRQLELTLTQSEVYGLHSPSLSSVRVCLARSARSGTFSSMRCSTLTVTTGCLTLTFSERRSVDEQLAAGRAAGEQLQARVKELTDKLTDSERRVNERHSELKVFITFILVFYLFTVQ